MTSHNKRNDGLILSSSTTTTKSDEVVDFGGRFGGDSVVVTTTDNNKSNMDDSFYRFGNRTTDLLHMNRSSNNNKMMLNVGNNNNSTSRSQQSTTYFQRDTSSCNDIPFFTASTTGTSNGFGSSSFHHPPQSSSLSPYTMTTMTTTRPYGDPMKNPTKMSLNTIMDVNNYCFFRQSNNGHHHHQEEKLLTTSSSVYNNDKSLPFVVDRPSAGGMMMTVSSTNRENKKTRLVGAGISLNDNDTNDTNDDNNDRAMIMRVDNDHQQQQLTKKKKNDGDGTISTSYTSNVMMKSDTSSSSNHNANFGDVMFNNSQQQQHLHPQQKLLSQTSDAATTPTPHPTPFAQMSQFLHNTSRGVPILRYKPSSSNNGSTIATKGTKNDASQNDDSREAIRFGTLLVKPGYEQEGVLAGKIRKVLTLRQPGCLWVEQVLRVDDSHNGLFRLLQISAWDSDMNMDIFNDGYESKSFWKNYIDMAVPSSFYWIEYYRISNPFVLTFQLGYNSSRKTRRRTKHTVISSQNRRCSSSTQKTSNSNNSTTTTTSTSAKSATSTSITTSTAEEQQLQEDETSNDNNSHPTFPLDDNVIRFSNSNNFFDENNPFKDKAVALSVWIEVTPLTTQLDLFYKLLLLSEACAIQEEGCLRYVIMTERTKKKKKKKKTSKTKDNDESTTFSTTQQHDTMKQQQQHLFNVDDSSITGIQKTSNRRNKRPRFTIYAVFKNEISYEYHSSQGYSVLSERLRAMCLKPTPTTTIFTRNPLCVF